MDTTPNPAPQGETDIIFSDGMESPAPPGPVFNAPFAVRVLNKAAYGPRPGDVAAFNALGGDDDARLSAWLTKQLNPDAQLPDNACTTRIANGNYVTTNLTLAQLWATYVRGGMTGWPQRYHPCEEAYCQKLIRAVYSERQLYEVMVDFWHNHFNVQGWEFNIAPVFMHYDRNVMRGTHPVSGKRYALGNFRAMLEEVAKAPAMLMYLDNKSSSREGFNENFARELCELHTLGAMHYYPGNDPSIVPDNNSDGIPDGYCDNDVYEAARALTGWTMRDGHWEFPDLPEYDTGEFFYFSTWHDPAAKFFLGLYILANGPALGDGQKVFDRLCQHPATAKHICLKLCRRFISDNPPQSLVDSAAAIFRAQWQAPDQIAQVLRHILTSHEFKNTWGEKTKRPWEALMHGLRATSAELTPRVTSSAPWNSYSDLNSRISESGNGPFRWPTPDGYPDHSRKWQAVSPLSQTWRTLSRLVEMLQPGSDEGNPAQTDFFMRIEQQTRTVFASGGAGTTAGAVVDFWVGRIFGYAIEASRRAEIVKFLGQKNTPAQAETVVLTWNNTWNSGNLSAHYTLSRLRAAVALLTMCPEFYQR